MGGGPLSGPAQLLSNAINNGTLRFDRNSENEEEEMDSDAEDQYNKSPSAIDDNAMIEDTSASSPSAFGFPTSSTSGPSVPASSSSGATVPLSSSAAPEKLSSPGGSALSPPSAVRGVQSASPRRKQADQANDELPHPAVQADGLMDHSEGPFKG